MKINTFYGFSKVYLLLILVIGLFSSFIEISLLGWNISWSLAQVIGSVLGLAVVLRLRNSTRYFRLLFLILLLPIFTYLTLNYVYDVTGLLTQKTFLSEDNSTWLSKILDLTYYYLIPINLMIAYKYEILDRPKVGGQIYVPEIISLGASSPLINALDTSLTWTTGLQGVPSLIISIRPVV